MSPVSSVVERLDLHRPCTPLPGVHRLAWGVVAVDVAVGGGIGVSALNRRRTFSVIRDTLFE